MKENYFTPQHLDRQAKGLLKSFKEIREKRAWQFTPNSAVLLVLDMQDYFLKQDLHAYVPAATAIIPRIQSLQQIFLKHQWPVIQTRHLNNSDNAGMMATWWRELIIRENEISRITAPLADDGAEILEKGQYDAFYQTPLEERLREQGITQCVITGVLTHLCCETTARTAFMRGFDVLFVVDATATYNRQFALSSLTNLSHGFATLVLSEELLARVGV